MINEVHPSESSSTGELAETIESKSSIKVFYPLWEGNYADYSGKVIWEDGKFLYRFGGHGIGNNSSTAATTEDMISRIMSDNDRFNSGGIFHFKKVDMC